MWFYELFFSFPQRLIDVLQVLEKNTYLYILVKTSIKTWSCLANSEQKIGFDVAEFYPGPNGLTHLLFSPTVLLTLSCSVLLNTPPKKKHNQLNFDRSVRDGG